MHNVVIAKLPIKRWKEYRALRLNALKSDPKSFGFSYKEQVNKPPKYWIEKLRNKNSQILFAFIDDNPIGMIMLDFEKLLKFKHIVAIYGLYVTKKYRGRGIAKSLLTNALKSIKKQKNIKKIRLGVNSTQKSAIKLYRQNGFIKTGTFKKELKIGKKYYNMHLMEKHI